MKRRMSGMILAALVLLGAISLAAASSHRRRMMQPMEPMEPMDPMAF